MQDKNVNPWIVNGSSKARLVSVTPNAEETMVYVARVSNPKNQNNPSIRGLIKYCAEHGHWSVFEQASMTVEIVTPLAISIQVLRHRSFCYQQFCLDGDTMIRLGNNSKVSIADLYRSWNGPQRKVRTVRCLNTDTMKFEVGEVHDVYYSGKKHVNEYVFRSPARRDRKSYVIRSTPEHRVLTQNGWKTIHEAYENGDLIAANGTHTRLKNAVVDSKLGYLYKSEEWLTNNRSLGTTKLAKLSGASVPTIKNWLRKYGLNFDIAGGMEISQAPRSGIDISFTGKLHSFMNWARTNVRKEHCEKCGHDGSVNRLEVSHKVAHRGDEVLAFDENNLQTLCSKCHTNHDIDVQNKVNGWSLDMGPKWVAPVSCTPIGVVDTYDISMNHHSHNFVANGLVTHNSGRYSDQQDLKEINAELPAYEDLVYLPTHARLQDTTNRQNSIPANDFVLDLRMREEMAAAYEAAIIAYNNLLEMGIAKEIARFVLPEGVYTRLYMTGNLRSFITFCRTRDDEGVVQYEHVELARCIRKILSREFPIAYESFFE
jgi:flavin-dependent thymidylate synthase